MVLMGWSDGATTEKTIFTCVYIGKKSSPEPASQYSIKLGADHPFMKGIKFVQIKKQVFIKGEIITKMQKIGWVILKFQEPLNQKS
jgi:hypothetical protein